MDQTPQYAQGLAALQAGRIDEARRLFIENEKAQGTTAETRAMVERAELALARGDLEQAATLLDQAVRRNPTLTEAYLGLARAAIFTQQLEEARTHARAAMTVGPEAGEGYTLMGLVHELEGDAEGARPLLAQGAERAPNSFLSQFNQGRALAGAGGFQDALPFLVRAVALNGRSLEAHLMLGEVHVQLGQRNEALKVLRRATELGPKSAATWGALADLLFGQKAYAEAKSVLAQGLAQAGPHPGLLEKSAACAVALDDVPGAVTFIEQQLQQQPTYEQGWQALATFTLLTRQLDRSEAAARELLRLNPKRWEGWLHLGDLYDAQSDEARAHEAYREAVKLAPEHWKVLMNFGAALVQSKAEANWREGRELLERAVRHAPPGELRPAYNLALAQVRLGAEDAALALAQQVQREAAGTPIAAEAKKLETNLRAK